MKFKVTFTFEGGPLDGSEGSVTYDLSPESWEEASKMKIEGWPEYVSKDFDREKKTAIFVWKPNDSPQA